MDNNGELNLIIRKATTSDNLKEIAELIYKTDDYIYPYWFGSLEQCLVEFPMLLVEEKFFFNINNLYIAIDRNNNKIVGLVCIVDKSKDFDYDYNELRNYNERYRFTIDNYIMGLIDEVKKSDFAYISNVCVHQDYRGKKIGNKIVSYVVEVYAKECFDEIVLDVIADNEGAVRLYQKLGFEQFTEIFAGFNGTKSDKPNVFSMKKNLNE